MVVVKTGDIVTRESYHHDIVFKVVGVEPNGLTQLKGVTVRLRADAPSKDLVHVSRCEVVTLERIQQMVMMARRHT